MEAPCNHCNREGQLVSQFVNPPMPRAEMAEPWVFRYYLCRYHRAAESRKTSGALPTKILKYRSDEDLLRGWTAEQKGQEQ